MPMVRIEMFPGRTALQKRQLADSITKSFAEFANSTPESVHIVFVEVSPNDWAVAGSLIGDPKKS